MLLPSRLRRPFQFLVCNFFKANKQRVLLDDLLLECHVHWVGSYIRIGSLDHIITGPTLSLKGR